MFGSLKNQSLLVIPKLFLLVAALFAGGVCEAQRTFAQQTVTPVTNQGRRVTLRDQLVSGLRAFTKADLQFIDNVVAAVEQGKLPRRIVDGTFFWARDRAARHSYRRRLRPMVYFRPAMVARAARLRVVL